MTDQGFVPISEVKNLKARSIQLDPELAEFVHEYVERYLAILKPKVLGLDSNSLDELEQELKALAR
jgi:hypothetical protein